MNVEEIRDYALAKEKVEEGFPFGDKALVFKTGGKMFLLVQLYTHPLQFNVKCQPEKALDWREQYRSVVPGYHMNKTHWNTVLVDGSLNRGQLLEMIDDSYNLVKKKKQS